MAAPGERGNFPNSMSNYTDQSAHAATYTLEPLREGSAGTFQTLAAMARAVLGQIPPDYSGYKDIFNIHKASEIVYEGFDNYINDIPSLFYFVRDEIQYANHPWDLQVVKDCRRTIESGSGDCVSKSVCLATLLAARGIQSRFVAQAPADGDFSHVYVEASTGGWVALDPTADGREGRPLFEPGDFQRLPDGGFETTYTIF